MNWVKFFLMDSLIRIFNYVPEVEKVLKNNFKPSETQTSPSLSPVSRNFTEIHV
jgi:hypothetical protein